MHSATFFLSVGVGNADASRRKRALGTAHKVSAEGTRRCAEKGGMAAATSDRRTRRRSWHPAEGASRPGNLSSFPLMPP